MASGAYGGRTNSERGQVTRGKHAGQRHVVRGSGGVSGGGNTPRTRKRGWQSLSEDAEGNQVYRHSGNRGGVSVPKGGGVSLPQYGGGVGNRAPSVERQDEIDRSFRAAQDAIYEQQQNYKNPQMMGYGPETGLDSALEPYWNKFREGRGPDGSYPELPGGASLYDRFTDGVVPEYEGFGDSLGEYRPDEGVGYLPTVPTVYPSAPPPPMPEAVNPMYETAYPPAPLPPLDPLGVGTAPPPPDFSTGGDPTLYAGGRFGDPLTTMAPQPDYPIRQTPLNTSVGGDVTFSSGGPFGGLGDTNPGVSYGRPENGFGDMNPPVQRPSLRDMFNFF